MGGKDDIVLVDPKKANGNTQQKIKVKQEKINSLVTETDTVEEDRGIKRDELIELIQDSFLGHILYERDREGNLLHGYYELSESGQSVFIEDPTVKTAKEVETITDVGFDGYNVYIQDNEVNRYRLNDPNKDRRILQGLPPLEVTEEDVKVLGTHISNKTGLAWTNTDPILDIEVGDLRTNFMNKKVSPYGTTMAVRVSRASLAVRDVEDISTKRVADLLKVFMKSGFNLLISGATGSGKAIADSEKVPTPNGWIKHGDLKVGDLVFERNGLSTTVIATHPQGMQDVYALELSDGRVVRGNKDHIWTVKYTGENSFTNRTLKEIIDETEGTDIEVILPRNRAVKYPLGDDKNSRYGLNQSIRERAKIFAETMLEKGHKEGKYIVIWETRREKAQEIVDLVRSNGVIAKLTNIDGLHKIEVDSTTIDKRVLKRFRWMESLVDTESKETELKIKRIEKLDYQENMQCIEVASEDHQYLVGDFVVTHNTETQKTLVGYIPDDKKITLMEDTMDSHIKEIYKEKDINSWRIQKKGEQSETDGVGWGELIKAGLRNNPDYLMISEIRGDEAAHLIAAALTDHIIMTTLHASGAANIPSRVVDMVAKGEQSVDYDTLNRNILSVLNLGLHMERIIDPETGRSIRRVKEIYEYVDFTPELGIIGHPIYEVTTEYDEISREYNDTHKMYRMSDSLIRRITEARQIDKVPAIFKTGKYEYSTIQDKKEGLEGETVERNKQEGGE